MCKVADSDPEELLDRAKAGEAPALGRLLELYRAYLIVLARVQIGRRLQGKVDASDVVQEAFLGACRDFPQFRGTTSKEFLGWLRQILASLLANLVRHYQGTQRRDVRLERQLVVELDQSSQALDRGLVMPQSSPSHQAMRREQSVLLDAWTEPSTASRNSGRVLWPVCGGCWRDVPDGVALSRSQRPPWARNADPPSPGTWRRRCATS
jgi:RNA polymerase sigma-70 factor (subfamily 1)